MASRRIPVARGPHVPAGTGPSQLGCPGLRLVVVCVFAVLLPGTAAAAPARGGSCASDRSGHGGHAAILLARLGPLPQRRFDVPAADVGLWLSGLCSGATSVAGRRGSRRFATDAGRRLLGRPLFCPGRLLSRP